jgi:ribosome-binding protein aMBF1 (putative translation factor)
LTRLKPVLPTGKDFHLGWEQFEYAVDQAASLKARQQTRAFNKAYGAAIRKLRQEKGLRQSDVAGLTARQVGRIESGHRATLSALQKLAHAHGLSLSDYLDQLPQRLNPRE